jgi:hypothetical protein
VLLEKGKQMRRAVQAREHPRPTSKEAASEFDQPLSSLTFSKQSTSRRGNLTLIKLQRDLFIPVLPVFAGPA